MLTRDASIVLRDLDTADPEHPSCHALLERLRVTATPVVVLTLLLAEVAGAVSRAWRDPIRGRLVAEALTGLPYFAWVALDEPLARAAAELAADRGLRGADAVYAAVAAQAGTTLVSLDAEHRTRLAAVVSVVAPAGALTLLSAG